MDQAQPPKPEKSAWFDVEDLPGSQFLWFLKISLRRAFRLRIEPTEVLPSERRALLQANPPIHEPQLQAFLAWRRSVLFSVACALIPLTVIGIGEALRNTDWLAIFFVKFLPAFAELVFCLICWNQLKRWTNWRKQKKWLFYGWLLFELTPFIVFIYPLNTFFSEIRGVATSGEKRMALLALGIDGIYRQTIAPFMFAMIAMLQLAPKAISLMPGMIRSSMVIKMLFPGTSAPGWLIVIAAPMYALLAYVILVIPYQFTGSGWFMGGVLGVIIAQTFFARAGFRLARPMSEAEAIYQVKRVRKFYLATMIISAVLIVIALWSLVKTLHISKLNVFLAVMKFETNIMCLTMIGSDLVVTNLDRARNFTEGANPIEADAEKRIAAFVSDLGPLQATQPVHISPPMHPRA
ncbi:MAG TPA: hypothetical protein VGM39_23685 [Kofleriaceae bacterium]